MKYGTRTDDERRTVRGYSLLPSAIDGVRELARAQGKTASSYLESLIFDALQGAQKKSEQSLA